MAHFRGTLQGARGEASRLGTRSSGLQTVAASWQGAVRVELYERDGYDCARISLTPHRGAGVNRLLTKPFDVTELISAVAALAAAAS